MEVVVIPASEPCHEDQAGIHAWGQHQAQRMLRSTFVMKRRLFGQVGGKGRPDLGAYPYLKFFSKGGPGISVSFGNEGLSHRATLRGCQTLIKDPKPNGGSTSPKLGVAWGLVGVRAMSPPAGRREMAVS